MLDPACKSRIVTLPQRPWIEGVSTRSKWLAASEQEQVLFGMDWVALVGGAPTQLAKKHIRLYRANMHTPFHHQSTVLGMATEAPPVSDNVSVYSAAALFAQAHEAQTSACLIVLAHGECWMVAAHQGRVLIQTDRWFEHLSEANKAVAAIEQRFPELQTQTLHLDEQSLMPEWIRSPGVASAKLIRTHRFSGHSKKVICGLSALLMLVAYFWVVRDKSEMPVANGDHLGHTQLQQWQDAIASRPVHGGQDIVQLIAAWNQVPVFPGGWRLERIDCQPDASHWHCMVVFQRVFALATAQSLVQSLPTEWKPEFTPLDQASVTFRMVASHQRLDASKKTSDISWLSQLQRMRIAFDHIQVGSSASLFPQHPFTPSVHISQESHPVASSWRKRALQIRGPLRSFLLLKDWEMPGWWQQVTLEVRDADQLGNSASRFVLTLNGEIYESQD